MTIRTMRTLYDFKYHSFFNPYPQVVSQQVQVYKPMEATIIFFPEKSMEENIGVMWPNETVNANRQRRRAFHSKWYVIRGHGWMMDLYIS
ncbi:hypothetical protein NPIL_387851 [Nephila pilipes]|uniref:Uncharacterized protein n=1 Tax=Nephila pilipes TaxID=299642 RepID=A0A8X6Q625_NEPPI|nr:hypothetical protein NPIL_387851 [Nephila pilipes]